MKTIYSSCGGITLIAEDARDQLWMQELIQNIPEYIKPIISNHITVGYGQLERTTGEITNTDVLTPLENCIEIDKQSKKPYVSIEPTEIDINPFGHYGNREIIEKIKTLLKQLK